MFTRRRFMGGLATAAVLAAWRRLPGHGWFGSPGTGPESAYFRAVNMVGRVSGDGAVVNLVTAESLAGAVRARVRWSEDAVDLPTSPNVSPIFASDGPTQAIELPITGLASDREYHYLVQYETDDAPGVWHDLSESGSFHSQRPPGRSFEFCVMADAHWGREDVNFDLTNLWGANCAASIRQIITSRPYDFCIDLGDSVLLTGLESQEEVHRHYENYRRVMAPITRRMPVFFVLGNHEQESGFKQRGDPAPPPPLPSPYNNLLGPEQYHQKWATRARLTFIPNPRGDTYPQGGEGAPGYDTAAEWGAGDDPWNDGERSHLQNFYAWEWGDALFVVLDPFRYTRVGQFTVPRFTSEWRLGPTQLRWLEDVLAGSSARWKFVISHHQVGGGLIGTSGQQTSEGGLIYGRGSAIEAARPGTEQVIIHNLMKQHCVQFFLYGHDHAFSHSVLDGVHYVQCGRPTFINDWYARPGMLNSYGNVLVQGRNKPWMRALYTVLGYMRFRVSPGRVAMEWVRTGYSYTPNRAAECFGEPPQRDWRESWSGHTYPLVGPDSVVVPHVPEVVDGVRSVAGATITQIHQPPPGQNYYVPPEPCPNKIFKIPEVYVVGFPAEIEPAAVVDYVPEVVYRMEWRLGDVNGDGLVNGEDIQTYLDARHAPPPEPTDPCALSLTPEALADGLLGR
jgi:hypothetical protein